MSAEIEIRPTTYAEWYALEEERDKLRSELAAARAQIEERRVVGLDEVVVKREEWEVLDEIAKIARPRCKKLDEAALCAAVLRLDKIRAPGDWESTPGIWHTNDALRSGEAGKEGA